MDEESRLGSFRIFSSLIARRQKLGSFCIIEWMGKCLGARRLCIELGSFCISILDAGFSMVVWRNWVRFFVLRCACCRGACC